MKRLHIPILTAVALVVSLIESMIPLPIVMPGAKLGLSNIVILTCLIVLDLEIPYNWNFKIIFADANYRGGYKLFLFVGRSCKLSCCDVFGQ